MSEGEIQPRFHQFEPGQNFFQEGRKYFYYRIKTLAYFITERNRTSNSKKKSYTITFCKMTSSSIGTLIIWPSIFDEITYVITKFQIFKRIQLLWIIDFLDYVNYLMSPMSLCSVTKPLVGRDHQD